MPLRRWQTDQSAPLPFVRPIQWEQMSLTGCHGLHQWSCSKLALEESCQHRQGQSSNAQQASLHQRQLLVILQMQQRGLTMAQVIVLPGCQLWLILQDQGRQLKSGLTCSTASWCNRSIGDVTSHTPVTRAADGPFFGDLLGLLLPGRNALGTRICRNHS